MKNNSSVVWTSKDSLPGFDMHGHFLGVEVGSIATITYVLNSKIIEQNMEVVQVVNDSYDESDVYSTGCTLTFQAVDDECQQES